MQKARFTARKTILFESLSTQALITSTKTLYLLHFLMQSADISFFKLVFTFFSFVFELPSGYFADRYGNRNAVLLSRILIASSMLFYCALPSFAGFLTANILLGIADAWESGAKDSYFLKQCLLQGVDYQDLKVRIAKHTYAVNFFLALVSTALFQASIYLPLLLTALFYIAATALLLGMPDDAAQPEQSRHPRSFFFTSKLILGCIRKVSSYVQNGEDDNRSSQEKKSLERISSLIIAGRDAPEIFQTTKTTLYYIPALVSLPVIFPGMKQVFSRRDCVSVPADSDRQTGIPSRFTRA